MDGWMDVVARFIYELISVCDDGRGWDGGWDGMYAWM